MNNEGQAMTINDAQHREFLAYLQKTRHAARDEAIYLCTYRAGLRIGETAKLQKADILDSKGELKEVVILRKAVTKGKKTRTAYFSHPELRAALSEWLNLRKNKNKKELFLSQKGCAFSPNSLAQLMLRHYNRAGLEGASSHSGRRSLCSSLLKNGVDIVAVAKIMGHASVSTTQRYVHHDQEELLKAVSSA